MSAGSPRVTVRLSPSLIAAIDHVIGKYNATQFCREPMTMTDFIVKACVEKIAHMERSRKKSRKLRDDPTPVGYGEPIDGLQELIDTAKANHRAEKGGKS